MLSVATVYSLQQHDCATQLRRDVALASTVLAESQNAQMILVEDRLLTNERSNERTIVL
jgi:hypothetical protein